MKADNGTLITGPHPSHASHGKVVFEVDDLRTGTQIHVRLTILQAYRLARRLTTAANEAELKRRAHDHA